MSAITPHCVPSTPCGVGNTGALKLTCDKWMNENLGRTGTGTKMEDIRVRMAGFVR